MSDDQVPPLILNVLAVTLKVRHVIDFRWKQVASSHLSSRKAEHGRHNATDFANDRTGKPMRWVRGVDCGFCQQSKGP
eukprot:scaffold1756_cov117-Isochrysis_galbana.AAC.10